MARLDIEEEEAEAEDTLCFARRLCDAGAEALVVHAAVEISAATLAWLPGELPGVPLICVPDARVPCEPAVYPAERLEAWGYRGVRNKYHRCYCSRMRDFARPADAPSGWASDALGRGAIA
jgi:hypothetical protein